MDQTTNSDNDDTDVNNLPPYHTTPSDADYSLPHQTFIRGMNRLEHNLTTSYNPYSLQHAPTPDVDIEDP